MEDILVSVVVPNYNHAPYLKERLDSVLAQTYTHYEVIILDDCSTDNSREVIEGYRQNEHVAHIVYNKENVGRVFLQWRKGIGLAKGDLVWIAESDDKCEPQLLERLVEQFKKNPGLALAFCKSTLFTTSGKTWTQDTQGLEAGVYDGKAFITTFMSHGCPMLNASACLFRKTAFEHIADTYTTFKAAGDRMFWTEISECGNVAVVDDRLNWYRKHDTNTTALALQTGVSQKENKRILDYVLERGYIDKKAYAQIRRHYLKKNVFELLADKHVQQDIYAFYGFSAWEQFGLRVEAWLNKLKFKKQR